MCGMLPAQQRLKTCYIAIDQTCLGLIMEHEFVPCQGTAQLRFHPQPRHCALIHLRQVKLIDRGPLLFRLKHGGIRAP